jgi:hypothetical protein
MLQRISAAVRVALMATVLTACGLTTYYPAPAGSVTTLMPGWERFFTLEWSAEPEREGSRRLDGYIVNGYGEYATDIRLLVQSLDASGNVVDQRIVWVPAGAGGFGRAYFDVRHLPASDHYQVFVWDYRIIQSAGLIR